MKNKILAFGEIIFDIQNGISCLGGAPLNFCAHAVKAGAEAYLISAVGDDSLGKTAIEKISAYGIKTDFINISQSEPTGKCIVDIDEAGIPKYNLAENTAYDSIPVPEKIGRDFDVLYFGSLALRSPSNIECVRKLIEMNCAHTVFADINIRPPFYSKESMLFVLENAEILKISDEELPLLINCLGAESGGKAESIKYIAESFKNIKLIVLTLGAEGSEAFDAENGRHYSCKAVKAEVVSTVGAGDSFSAAFLCSYLNGEGIEASLKKASEISAFVVSHLEAIPEY